MGSGDFNAAASNELSEVGFNFQQQNSKPESGLYTFFFFFF